MNEFITEAEKKEYLEYTGPDKVFQNYMKGLEELGNTNLSQYQNSVLISGGMVGFDKGLSDFLNTWYGYQKDLFLLSEVTAEFRRYTDEKIRMPHICTPHLLAKEIILLGMELSVTDEIEEFSKSKSYIKDAIYNLEQRYGGRLGNGYAKVWAYYAYQYIDLLLRKIDPRVVVMWNQFYAFHMILEGMCKEKEIPTVYMEFGSVPGTIAIDYDGQMGESEPAYNYKKYRRKKVSRVELSNAGQVLLYLKKSELNRNLQPVLTIKDINLTRYDSKRKTILYMGQNDYESGLYPRNEKSEKYHSPVFESSLKGFEFLSILSIKNNWNLIYKPHPIMIALQKETRENTDCADIVNEVNINSVIDCADVVTTILSQSAYIALIREKPVVMIGYTQLRGKRCTYEAFSKKKIEVQLKNAIKKGYTEKMRLHFRKHIAQLLKYSLYDDGVDRELRFGQNIERLEIKEGVIK